MIQRGGIDEACGSKAGMARVLDAMLAASGFFDPNAVDSEFAHLRRVLLCLGDSGFIQTGKGAQREQGPRSDDSLRKIFFLLGKLHYQFVETEATLQFLSLFGLDQLLQQLKRQPLKRSLIIKEWQAYLDLTRRLFKAVLSCFVESYAFHFPSPAAGNLAAAHAAGAGNEQESLFSNSAFMKFLKGDLCLCSPDHLTQRWSRWLVDVAPVSLLLDLAVKRNKGQLQLDLLKYKLPTLLWTKHTNMFKSVVAELAFFNGLGDPLSVHIALRNMSALYEDGTHGASFDRLTEEQVKELKELGVTEDNFVMLSKCISTFKRLRAGVNSALGVKPRRRSSSADARAQRLLSKAVRALFFEMSILRFAGEEQQFQHPVRNSTEEAIFFVQRFYRPAEKAGREKGALARMQVEDPDADEKSMEDQEGGGESDPEQEEEGEDEEEEDGENLFKRDKVDWGKFRTEGTTAEEFKLVKKLAYEAVMLDGKTPEKHRLCLEKTAHYGLRTKLSTSGYLPALVRDEAVHAYSVNCECDSCDALNFA